MQISSLVDIMRHDVGAHTMKKYEYGEYDMVDILGHNILLMLL